MSNRKIIFTIPLVVAITSLIFVFTGIFKGWFGPAGDGVMVFCEHARNGYVKQPANTFSNFAFVLFGLYIGYLGSIVPFKKSNLMASTLFYPTFFATVVVFLGPGSMAMHATNAYWGGFMDLLSMFMLSSFIFCFGLTRYFDWSPVGFLVAYIINVAIGCWIFLTPAIQIDFFIGISSSYFAMQLIGGLFAELANRYLKGVRINTVRGWISVGVLLTSFAIWIISKDQDSWFCNPHSYIQGHAIWHILDAFAGFLLFRYYISEEAAAIS